MARNVANVDILTDTFNTWILRTNEVIGVLNSEALTANATLGVTGTLASPRNALLHGTFTANTLASNALSVSTDFIANSSTILVGKTLKFIANNSSGTPGQTLTTDGSSIYWSTAPGSGTVTQIANGAGIYFSDGNNGSTISGVGKINLRANTGIIVDTGGIFVNAAYISTITTNASTLLSRTWVAPGQIGLTTANTGAFTTLTADTISANTTAGYRLTGDNNFIANSSMIRTAGYVDATTPNSGTTGGVRIRSTGTGAASVAYLQITNSDNTDEFGNFKFHSNGQYIWSGSASIAGSLALSTDNTTGGGIILSGDGDIVDLNDGFAAHRFTNGLQVYSGNKTGTPAITLGSNGTINAKEILIPTTSYVKLSDFTENKSANGWTKLPNGVIIQWGSFTAATTGGSVSFPISFNTLGSVTLGPGGPNTSTNVQNNFAAIISASITGFSYENYDGTAYTTYYIAIGY